MPEEESKKSVSADSRIVDALWKIAEPDDKVRLDNIEIIVNTLSLKNISCADDNDGFTDLDYTLKRLISGLASTRKAARHGFSVALCEVLRNFNSIDANSVISLIFKLIPLSNVAGERSAPVVGQILAFGSLIRSGMLNKYPASIPSIVESVIELSDQKAYVEQATCFILQDLFSQTTEEIFVKHLWPVLKFRLSSGWEKASPKTLWMLSVCKNLFSNVISQDFLLEYWATDELFKLETYHWLGKILKMSTVLHPLVHPLCTEIVNHLVKLKQKDFKRVWCVLMEESLLQVNQFQEAYLLFELVKLTIPKLKNHKQVSYLFSTKFHELFIKSLRTKHSPLHKAASQLCDFLGDYAANCDEPNVQFAVLKVFLTPPSSLLFDQMMKKSTVQSIVSKLKEDALQKYTQLLLGVLCDKEVQEDQLLTDSIKCDSARQLARIISHPMAEESLKSQILQLLFLYGFFSIKKETEEIPWCDVASVLSESVRDSCRSNFLRGLQFVQMPPVKKGYRGRLDHQLLTLTPVLEYADTLLNSSDVVELGNDQEDLVQSWRKMKSMLKKVVRYSEKDGRNDETTIFQIFYLQLSFQLFYDLESTKKILCELNECCKRSLKYRKNFLREDHVEISTEEPYWADVVMDLMMSMLSDQSHFLRSLVSSVFPALCPFMTANSVNQLVEAINIGQDENPLENEDDEELEFDSGSSSSSDEEEANGIGDDVDDQFRKKIKAALGHAAEGSDEDETYLTDSEMCKLDDAIAEAFLQRAQPNKKKDKLKEELIQTHFRLRCLDLLGIYVKREPSLQHMLLLIEPLVVTAKSGLNNKKLESLSTKACSILLTIATLKKYKGKDDVQQKNLQSLLSFLLGTVQKVSDLKLKNVVVRLCSFVVLCSEAVAKADSTSPEAKLKISKWYFELCTELINNYFDKNALDLSPQLIESLLVGCADHSEKLLDSLEIRAFEISKRLFKQTQAISLISSILRKVGAANLLHSISTEKLRSLLLKATIALQGSVETEKRIKPMFVSKLLELISVLMNVLKSRSSDKISEERQLLSVLNAISLNKLDRKGKKCAKKLLNFLKGVGMVKTDKRRNDDPSSNNIALKKQKLRQNV